MAEGLETLSDAPKYEFPPEVLAELERRKSRIRKLHTMGLINLEQANRMFWDAMVELQSRNRVEAGDNVVVKCEGCEKTHVIPRDVKTYRCGCSPSVERFTFKNRVLTGVRIQNAG